MRFGLSFPTYRVPGWTLRYVDYHAFKKLLKASRYQDVHESLLYELAKVETFYLTQSRELHRRTLELQQTDHGGLEKHIESPLDLLEALQKLCWFGYVNYVAFRRLLQKVNANETHSFQRLLEDQSFMHQTGCLQDLRTVEATLESQNGFQNSSNPSQVSDTGDNPRLSGASGWTATEHAGYRGHWRLMKSIAETNAPTSLSPEATNNDSGHILPSGPTWLARRSNSLDTTQGHILVNLGASNTRSGKAAVELRTTPWRNYDGLRRQTGFALEIDIVGGAGSSELVLLPMLEDVTNQPIVFISKIPQEAIVVFRLFRVQDYRRPRAFHIGSGVAILSTLKERLASKHESLVRDNTIPILAKATLDMIGSLTFSFLVVTPLEHPIVPSVATRGFWNQDGRTEIVGHRGSGANTTRKTNLLIGENTIQSFLSAVASGASCVEFDVQLTKDLAPVIFHDFLVMETGGDVPLHTLTRDQFLHLSRLQSFDSTPELDGRTGKPRQRSQSENGFHRDGSSDLRHRMEYTEEGIRNEIKGNLRGCSIQEPSTTLEELLVKLPESIAFNLELKYPMLWEAEDRSMDFFAMELNLFVDTILKLIYRLGGKRSITFSSFSPEVCILLSIKQQDYPILFISKAGSVPTGDVRAGSLQQAIHFAKAWDLAGIVMLSEVFVLCPRLLRYAKSKGLVCGSYGDLNDDPDCAKIQAEAGLDAIMVNRVHLISQTLHESSKSASFSLE
ncbi:MAG: hypothetical protein Q9166_004248 [cf. Caloplaca sp. 2 TL-2023]